MEKSAIVTAGWYTVFASGSTERKFCLKFQLAKGSEPVEPWVSTVGLLSTHDRVHHERELPARIGGVDVVLRTGFRYLMWVPVGVMIATVPGGSECHIGDRTGLKLSRTVERTERRDTPSSRSSASDTELGRFAGAMEIGG